MRGFRCTVLVLASVSSLLMSAAHVFAQRQAPSEAQISAAADRAVRWLQKASRGGTWEYMQGGAGGPHAFMNDVGATALAGLALLESDVPRNDPLVSRAAAHVRQYAASCTQTYPVCCAIMFLDRYGEGRDSGLIRTLAIRLAASQNRGDGGWSYETPALAGGQEAQWADWLSKNRGPFNFANMKGDGGGAPSDNSNTQFAVLALFIARRQKLPVEFPLLLCEHRFRTSQSGEGGWGYAGAAGFQNTTPSMTCAGLLALAVGFGTQKERQANLRAGGSIDNPGNARPAGPIVPDIRNDPQVQSAKRYIAQAMKGFPDAQIPHLIYFLWSLERVGVTFGFKDIEGVDWYDWGAAVLLHHQNQDGSWTGHDGVVPETCFALLFLRKANLLHDLGNVISGKASFRSTGGDLTSPTAKPSTNIASNDPKTPGGSKSISEDKAEAEAKKLGNELVKATGARRDEILQTLAETKDSTGNFTQALVDAIPKVSGTAKDRVRDALAQRYSRQTISSLRSKLKDGDEEVRMAAAKACGLKGDREIGPDLVALLKDNSEDVSAAAEESLKILSDGRDFGRNQERWREFWQKNKK